MSQVLEGSYAEFSKEDWEIVERAGNHRYRRIVRFCCSLVIKNEMFVLSQM